MMTNEIESFKGKRMLERAEELDAFWAYSTEQLPEDKQLVLLDNVQFIYELALAQLELQSLGVRIDLYKESLKEMFRVLKPNKYAVIVIGNATYLSKEIKTVEFTIVHAEKIGFKLVRNIDKIIFGLYNVMQKFLRGLCHDFSPATAFSY